ncbi:MAG TPA: hypothetical protein VK110_02810, partial [Salinisphaeraceae bacterium]|nr:hypothetical protein [Salinisphaeraceae bacterium]
MSEPASLKSPRYWPSWLAVGLGWLLGKLPWRLQLAIGRRLGDLARVVLGRHRRIAQINIRLCFPELSKRQQQLLVRDHFRSIGMAAAETALCWWGDDATIRRLASIEGFEHLQQAATRGKGIILFSAHFTALELGVRIGQQYLRRLGIETTAMY